MYLKEGYALCLETCKNGNEKCSFHLSATYDQKICFSYVIHQRNSANVRSTRIYFSSYKQWGAPTKVPSGKQYYATHPQTVHAGTTHVLNVKVEKNSYRESR